MEKEVKLRGTVKKILWPRASQRTIDNDFMIAILEKDGIETTFKGNIYGVAEKEEILISGKWVQDKKYGLQFNVIDWERPIPTTREQAIELLSSGIIRGCGPKRAEDIVNALGADAIEKIMKDKKCLETIRGIGPKTATKIKQSLEESYSIQRILRCLSQYGITPKMAIKLYKKYKSNSVEVVKENPYVLTNLRMISFDRADSIARNMGVPEDSLYRCEAGVLHILKEHNGHCYENKRELVSKSVEMLNKNAKVKTSDKHVEDAIASLHITGTLEIENDKVYLQKVYEQEVNAARKLAELVNAKCPVMPKNRIEQEIKKYQAKNCLILNTMQKKAIFQLFSRNVLVLTGGPGTGKTCTIQAIASIYENLFPDHTIALSAPTGRASQNISDEGQTIHRLINWGAKETGNQKDEHNPLSERLIIVDELSMADIEIFSMLMAAIKNGSRVLFVGDPDQLPSVGAGAVLRDLINSPIPHVELTEIYRQAKNSMIIENAHRVKNGKMVIDDPEAEDFYFIERPDVLSTQKAILHSVKRLLAIGYKPEDILVLSLMKKGDVGTQKIDAQIKQIINPPSIRKAELSVGERMFRVGDIIIQNKKNNVDRGLYNGLMGTVLDICVQDDEKGLLCNINGKEHFLTKEDILTYDFQTAYCITAHKSQGGQAKAVVVPVVTNHYVMLTRNIIYTAMTRAKEMLVMVGQKKAMAMAIANVQHNNRKTFLAERVNREISKTQAFEKISAGSLQWASNFTTRGNCNA